MQQRKPLDIQGVRKRFLRTSDNLAKRYPFAEDANLRLPHESKNNVLSQQRMCRFAMAQASLFLFKNPQRKLALQLSKALARKVNESAFLFKELNGDQINFSPEEISLAKKIGKKNLEEIEGLLKSKTIDIGHYSLSFDSKETKELLSSRSVPWRSDHVYVRGIADAIIILGKLIEEMQ